MYEVLLLFRGCLVFLGEMRMRTEKILWEMVMSLLVIIELFYMKNEMTIITINFD